MKWSKTTLDVYHDQKGPIKAAKWNGVTYYKMTNYNSYMKWSKTTFDLRK